MVQRGTALAELGVAALQITPVHYLFRPGDESMLEFYRAATEQTGLAGDHLQRGAVELSGAGTAGCRILRDVPGVIGVKQSAGEMKLLADLLREAPAGSLILSAVGRPALPFVRARRARRGGGDPQRGAGRLRFAVECGRRRRPALRPGPARQAAALWNAIAGDRLPACVKHAQSLQQCPAGLPRAPMPPASATQQQAIAHALAALEVAT